MSAVAVDVICQHSKDGTIIPLRVKIKGEDGEYQAYTIDEYHDHSREGTRELPGGVYVTNETFVFECSIVSFGRKRIIWLVYEPTRVIWKLVMP